MKNKYPLDKIIQGDTLQVLKTFPDDCIDCIITSPPYWGLRDYGEQTNTIWDNDTNCKHEFEIDINNIQLNKTGKYNGDWDRPSRKEYSKAGNIKKCIVCGKEFKGKLRQKFCSTKCLNTLPNELRTSLPQKSSFCKKCGAWYGQLGLEPTLDLYLEHMLQITSELKRVLKPTGVMFWNHGDSYATQSGSGKIYDNIMPGYEDKARSSGLRHRKLIEQQGIPRKSLFLQNYRLILRMIDEQGWILRNVIIWHKPNHMPSSVKDRFTNSYEPVFMLTKNKKYWFDLDAVRVPHKTEAQDDYYISIGKSWHNHLNDRAKGAGQKDVRTNHPLGKNPGDLWTIPTQPFPEAHFATFPEKLVEPMIKSGCPEWICKKCGKVRERITKTNYKILRSSKIQDQPKQQQIKKQGQQPYGFKIGAVCQSEHITLGWSDCGCNSGWKPGIVLDPFAGSGTTLYVARKLNRHYIGIELNPEYIKIAKKRLSKFGKRLEEFIEE